ncbi:MAG: PIG-L family deacetylase [Desulfosudaceae bacterium]
MDKKMNILAIGAHPDDIEIGCGGSLIKYSDKGHNIFLMLMTQGEEGGQPQTRKAEQEKAAALLGVQEIFWGEVVDTHLKVNLASIQIMEAVLAKVRPNFIFCPFSDDTHQDHRHLAQITISATRYVKNVLFYEGPTTQRFAPDIYIDISEKIDRKIELLKAHESQMLKTNIEGVSIVDIAYSSANFRGIQGRVKYAEAFCALRLFINI